MNKIFSLIIATLLISCGDNVPVAGTFGTTFDKAGALTLDEALASYNNGKDTLYSISGTIENVCKHEGCWISFKDAGGNEFYINNDETYKFPAKGKGHKATAKGKFVKDENGEVSFETTGVIIE